MAEGAQQRPFHVEGALGFGFENYGLDEGKKMQDFPSSASMPKTCCGYGQTDKIFDRRSRHLPLKGTRS